MKILLISILGHQKIGLDLGVISMHSRFFYLRSRYRIRVAKISKIFLRGGGSGCLIFLILMRVNGIC